MMGYWWSVVPNGKFRKYYGNYANSLMMRVVGTMVDSSSFAKHYLLFLVLLLLLVTTQYN